MVKERGLGAVPNLPDNRNIPMAVVAAVKGVDTAVHPKKRITDISMLPVEDQKKLGSCVGQSEGKGEEYREFKETGKVTRLSKRFIYKRCKDQDGYNGEGTYPAVAAKVLTQDGAPRVELVADNNDLPHDQFLSFTVTPEILTDASRTRVKGYAFPKNLDELKTAVDMEGLLNISVQVGDWDRLPVKPTPSEGWHRILVYGYEDAKNGKLADTKIYFRNSWGKNWAKATSSKDRTLQKEGNGWFWWSEYVGFVQDMQVYTDMPNEIIDYARSITFKFTRELQEGSRGTDVTELQKRLWKEPAKDGLPCFRYPKPIAPEYTAYYGVHTTAAVALYQEREGIAKKGDAGYGRLGPVTRASLNGQKAPRGLFPRVQGLRDQLKAIMAAVGHPIAVTDEYRSYAEQDALYAQGRTKPGPIVTNARGGDSFHNHSCAFDVAFVKGAGITYDGDWAMLGKVGKALGLEWGGDWASFPDRPHFQYTAGYTLEDFKAGRIDEGRFGIEIIKATGEINTPSTMKRVKSFFIIFGSAALTAFVAVLPTVEFANFADWLQQVVLGWGVPGVVYGLGVAFVAQLWFAWRNRVNIRKWEEGTLPASAVARGRGGREEGPDLY